MTAGDLIAAAGAAAGRHHGFFDGFGWDTGGTILAAGLAAIIAVYGYTRQKRAARRSEMAGIYGEAIRAVEDYLEAPYRIRRKDGTAQVRTAISNHISDVKSRISYYQALLQMHAPPAVTIAFESFVSAAQQEAGPQMTAAWHEPPVAKDDQVPLGVAYPRDVSDAARAAVVDAMKRNLAKVG